MKDTQEARDSKDENPREVNQLAALAERLISNPKSRLRSQEGCQAGHCARGRRLGYLSPDHTHSQG